MKYIVMEQAYLTGASMEEKNTFKKGACFSPVLFLPAGLYLAFYGKPLNCVHYNETAVFFNSSQARFPATLTSFA